jgi:hypothetical protein
MGKLDDMRRQREALHRGEALAPAEAAAADPTVGRCTVCRKVLALQHDGAVGNHQKGLGKMCPGSRQPPSAV